MKIAITLFFSVFLFLWSPETLIASWLLKAILTSLFTVIGVVITIVKHEKRKTFDKIDVLLLAVMFINILSSVMANIVSHYSLVGPSFEGALTTSIYILLIFMVKHFYQINDNHLRILIISSAICSLFSIVNLMGIFPNLFDYFNSLSPMAANYNLLGLAVSMMVGVTVMYYIEKKDIVSYICLLPMFLASISCRSDNVFFGFLIVAIMAFWRTFNLNTSFKYVFRCLSLFISSMGIYHICGIIAPSWNRHLQDSTLSFISLSVNWKILLAVAVLIYAITLIPFKGKKNIKRFEKPFLIFILCIVIIAIMSIIVVNVFKIDCPLLIDDKFGNARGAIWRVSIDSFVDAPLYIKLIGAGTDNAYYSVYNYLTRTPSAINLAFLYPHNIILKILIENGIIGLISYIGLFSFAIYNFCKNKKTMWSVCALCGLLAYISCSMITVSSPEITPFACIFLGYLLGYKNKNLGS